MFAVFASKNYTPILKFKYVWICLIICIAFHTEEYFMLICMWFYLFANVLTYNRSLYNTRCALPWQTHSYESFTPKSCIHIDMIHNSYL